MNVEHVQRDALVRAAAAVLTTLQGELAGLADSHGCEAGAQRAYLRGKYDAVTVDIWKALGLEPLMLLIDTDLLLDPVKQPADMTLAELSDHRARQILRDRQAPVD